MPEVLRRGYLRIDLTDNCNIRCIMCQAYNSMPVTAMKFLDFDKFVENTRGELGKWNYIQFGNAAEATIHPRFREYLRYVRSEAPDSTIHIVTNAKTLHKFTDSINEAGNCLVQVSMDSIDKKVHEYIREGSSYDRALANLRLLDQKRAKVLLSFTLMRSNVDEFPEMLAFCRENGYHMSAFPMIARSEIGVLPYNLLEESLWFSIEKLRRWVEDHYGAGYRMVHGTASGATRAATEFTCNAHYRDLSIDAIGNVTLCGKVTLGDLGRQSLQSLWDGHLAKSFRLQVDTDREPCMTCDYRQRCVCPSMVLIDNHFSAEITSVLPPSTRHALGYERTISDDEARWMFVRDVSNYLGVFDIAKDDKAWTARRVTAGTEPAVYQYGEPITAATRHELHELMSREADSGLNMELIEGYGRYNLVKYMRKYWALPLALGHLNITQNGDRQKPGILVAESLGALKKLCGPGDAPRLIGSRNSYNLVSYDGKFWGIPCSFGPFDLSEPANQTKEGLKVAPTMDEVEKQCGGGFSVMMDAFR